MSLRYYFYIDENAINSLYNQICKNVIYEKITRTKNEKDILGGHISASVPKIVEAKVHETSESYSASTIEKQIENTLEDKIEKILHSDEIRNNSNLRVSDAVELYNSRGTDLFYCKGIFNLIRSYKINKDGTLELLEDPQNIIVSYDEMCLVFQYGKTIENEQYIERAGRFNRDPNYRMWEYYQDNTYAYGVDMYLYGKHMKGKIWSLNSHTELRKNFSLHVFGQLEYAGDTYYCLNPFVVWQAPIQ